MEVQPGLLLLTAATVGVLHALAGPDHYLPLIAVARARRWSLARTVRLTLWCGAGHVAAALAVGGLVLALGWSLEGVGWLDAARGNLAAWLLIGGGLAYALWGIRQAARDRSHSHWHVHADGTAHEHEHVHRGAHAHPHEAGGRSLTPWLLFLVLVLGPCEVLVPLLMVPAAEGSWVGVAQVAAVFALATVAAMLAAVTVGFVGAELVRLPAAARYGHTLAGLAMAACGAAVWLGF